MMCMCMCIYIHIHSYIDIIYIYIAYMAYILQMMLGCRFMADLWWDDHGMWSTGRDFFHGIADGI